MERCMIVEKSSVVRKVSKRILGETVLVVEAENAHQALSLCETEMPDQIIVETELTGMDVYDFVRAVRAMTSEKRPIIIMSSISMDLVQMTKAKRAGADSYLLKPFNRTQLLSRFEEIVQQTAQAA